MWRTANRTAKVVSDLLIASVLVVVYVALVDREVDRARHAFRATTADGTPLWRTQISP